MGTSRETGAMTPVLVDTGFLIALYDRSDPYHQICVQFHLGSKHRLITCEAVVIEAIYMLRKYTTATQGILESIRCGALELPFRLGDHAAAVAKLMEKYSDTPADLADACLIQMADELDTGDILTLDSDFLHYRWRKNRRFNLLIPLG